MKDNIQSERLYSFNPTHKSIFYPITKYFSKYFKYNFSQEEYNHQVLDIKEIIFNSNKIQIQNQNDNSSNQIGVILQEAINSNKVQINFNDISENKNIIKMSQNMNILRIVPNYSTIGDSWIDYLSKYFFKSNNKFSLNNFFKKTKNNRSKQRINNYDRNLEFNCDGTFFGFINQEGDIVISQTEINNETNSYNKYLLKMNGGDYDEIVSFKWDNIYPTRFYYGTKTNLYDCSLSEKEQKCYINKNYSLLSFFNFINCFPSPKGDILLLLYKNHIEIYNIFQEKIFSKTFNSFDFINGIFDHKNSAFIAYTKKDLIIFNLENFDFKTYSYFLGNIMKVISGSDSDDFYIFTQNPQITQINEVFMYIISENSNVPVLNSSNKFCSYQNDEFFYQHCNYSLRPEIYCFKCENFGRRVEGNPEGTQGTTPSQNMGKPSGRGTKVVDVKLSPNDNRIGILYQDLNQGIESFMYNLIIFGMAKKKEDKSVDKIMPLYNFGFLDDCKILSFGFNKTVNVRNNEENNNNRNVFTTSLLVRFSQDNFVIETDICG